MHSRDRFAAVIDHFRHKIRVTSFYLISYSIKKSCNFLGGQQRTKMMPSISRSGSQLIHNVLQQTFRVSASPRNGKRCNF